MPSWEIQAVPSLLFSAARYTAPPGSVQSHPRPVLFRKYHPHLHTAHIGQDMSALHQHNMWYAFAPPLEKVSQMAYFMVFRDKSIEGAYTLADFAEMLKTM